MNWTCAACHETSEDDFDVCWRCGAGRDGSPPDAAFRRDEEREASVQRHLDCLRCTTPMRFAGRKRFHEGTRAWAFLLAELGELFVHRESFDVYACPACGKVEFFVGPAAPGT